MFITIIIVSMMIMIMKIINNYSSNIQTLRAFRWAGL